MYIYRVEIYSYPRLSVTSHRFAAYVLYSANSLQVIYKEIIAISADLHYNFIIINSLSLIISNELKFVKIGVRERRYI